MNYDVIIVGAGPGGIYSAYELARAERGLKIGVLEFGKPLDKRRCPIDGKKVKSCIRCQTCSIMSGFGGAGAFSDGKYNITNQFGGTLYEHIGKQQAIDLMKYVDSTQATAARGQSSIPPPTPASSACAWRTACTCWTRRCAIWGPTSTMWCWKTSITC